MEEYFFTVLFLQDERMMFCVNCGNFKQPKAELRPAEQSEIDFSPMAVFPGVLLANEELLL